MKKIHLQILVGLWFAISACGPSPEQLTATFDAAQAQTQTAAPTQTFTPTPSKTPEPTNTPTPTNTPNLVATQQYEEFSSIVQTIYDAGHISTTEGTFEKLDDFSDQLAQPFGYSWSKTGVKAKNFIVRADFIWSVAHQKNYSGCGYVFREESSDFFYMIALDALDGVLLSYTKEGYDAVWGKDIYNYSIEASRRMKLPDMGDTSYQAKFTLVVNEFKAYTYINDIFYSEYALQKNWLTETGPLSFMILTGSDIDYGTRCEIANATVWVINE